MIRLIASLLLPALVLAACAQPASPVRPDGSAPVKAFRIGAAEKRKIPFRMLDSVNAFRAAGGLPPVELSVELTAAAATHSRDMSVQNRPWHFGSDGSTPVQRVARAGYTGRMLGENISETFESDIETLAAWMQDDLTRSVIMDPEARYMGISWFQEPNGKIWWTQIFGS